MNLTKTCATDQISVAPSGLIEIREVTTILEEGSPVSTAYHRRVLSPGSDLSGEDDSVVAIASAVWTPEVIDSWKGLLEDVGGVSP